MPDRSELIWLFFGFSGRVSRSVYFLAGLLLVVAQAFLLYQVMRHPEGSSAGNSWSAIFLIVFLVSLWSHIALSVKRLHDIGRPGMLAAALFIPVVSIIAFIILCVFPGDPGKNQYGEHTNTR